MKRFPAIIPSAAAVLCRLAAAVIPYVAAPFSMSGQRMADAPLQFTRLTANEGLSYNAVKCMMQDSRGYIWIGTYKGLNRYDGTKLKKYVQDILRTYRNDSRILYWCLCNEPENLKNGCDVSKFMPEVYKWAWEVRPSQPLSSPVWQRPGIHGTATKLDLVAYACMNSDIITFHCYSKPKEVETDIQMLSRFGRPMVCQEYLARNYGNTFFDVLPILKKYNVGAINWGLVNGKCHFHYPWGHKVGDPEPEIWFHDIFRPDHTPYDPAEITFLQEMTKK